METPDRRWRVEVYWDGRAWWYRVRRGRQMYEHLTISAVAALLGDDLGALAVVSQHESAREKRHGSRR